MPKTPSAHSGDAAAKKPTVRKGVHYRLIVKPGKALLEAADTGEVIEFPNAEEARKAMR